jgi:hypothetical protein
MSRRILVVEVKNMKNHSLATTEFCWNIAQICVKVEKISFLRINQKLKTLGKNVQFKKCR